MWDVMPYYYRKIKEIKLIICCVVYIGNRLRTVETGMFTRLRKMWKVYENFVELLGGGGVPFVVWKEKFRLAHEIDKARYLLCDEFVCSVDGIMTGCQFVSFCTIQGWSRISYFILFSAQYYIMWHTLVRYIPYCTLL
jgi:hypothetical protein